MLNPLQKVAVFLFMIGLEKGRKIMDLMDSAEIKNIFSEFGKRSDLSPDVQASVWYEFAQLGYEAEMNSAETLYVLRQLFNGGKISDKEKISYRKNRR
jgi:flagellar motor switch protein FliG